MAGRPRGFIENWKPRESTLGMCTNVQSILDDNREILPLTLRQIFYMLVTGFEYDKTEKSYKRLCEIMNKARRGQIIDMDDIRDDGARRKVAHSWDSEGQLIDTFISAAENFRLDIQNDQPQFIMVWCEAAGMLPQLATACEPYCVPVISSGGFDSVTTKHKFAKEISEYGKPVEILHIGDHDPSGVHMCSSLDEDLASFVEHYGGEVSVTRLAITPPQIEKHNFPTSPPKPTDNRSFSGMTTQAEAMPPKLLRKTVVTAIEKRLDHDAYELTLENEKEIRENLGSRLRDIL